MPSARSAGQGRCARTCRCTDVTDPARIDSIAAEIIGELHRAFTLTGGEATISASMGVALYPEDDFTPDELVSKADEAMYASKSSGRNQFQHSKPTLRHKSR